MTRTTVSAGHPTYEEAFAVAAKQAGTKRKLMWQGRVRIKYRRATKTFDVQVRKPAAPQ